MCVCVSVCLYIYIGGAGRDGVSGKWHVCEQTKDSEGASCEPRLGFGCVAGLSPPYVRNHGAK